MRALLRCGAWIGLFLGTVTGAQPAPAVQLELGAAWQGWTRPGQASELRVRLASDAERIVQWHAQSGPQAVLGELPLVPGRAVALAVPMPLTNAGTVQATVQWPQGRVEASFPTRPSDRPLLGWALSQPPESDAEPLHAIALGPEDLPEWAPAYATVEVLVLDGATLRALRPAQRQALLSHVAACGRLVVVDPDERSRQALHAQAGCAGVGLQWPAALQDVPQAVRASMDSVVAGPVPVQGLEAALPARREPWASVALVLAVSTALLLGALSVSTSGWVTLGIPALACAALGLGGALAPWGSAPLQAFIWSEGESGGTLARYQAVQRVTGTRRGEQRVAVVPALAANVQPCRDDQPVDLVFDAERAQVSAVRFPSRLFGTVALCHRGLFPVTRSLAVDGVDGNVLRVRNHGTQAWPPGRLLADGQVWALPELAPSASAALVAQRPAQDTVVRMARQRADLEARYALWALDLSGVQGLPADSQAWLMVRAQGVAP